MTEQTKPEFSDSNKMSFQDRADAIKAAAETKAQEARDEAERNALILEETEKHYPLPKLLDGEIFYRMTQVGPAIFKREFVRVKGGNFEEVTTAISSPIGAIEKLKVRGDSDTVYGLRIAMKNLEGIPFVFDIPRDQIARADGEAGLKSMLLKYGLVTNTRAFTDVINLLMQANPTAERTVWRKPGWKLPENDVATAYWVSPYGTIVGADDDAVELMARPRMRGVQTKAGTKEAFLAAAEKMLSYTGNKHWGLCYCAGAAGLLSSLAELPSQVINLAGVTGQGKSQGERLLVAMCGDPAMGRGMMQSFRTSDNAVESLAEMATGSTLVLDEGNLASADTIYKTVFMLASDMGKNRSRTDGELRDTKTWNTFVVMSNETTIPNKLAKENVTFTPGLSSRLIDVNVDEIAKQNVDPGVMAEIDDALKANYGHIVPELAQYLLHEGLVNPSKILSLIIKEGDGIFRRTNTKVTNSNLVRQVRPLAVCCLAGKLLKEAGLAPQSLNPEQVCDWAWSTFAGDGTLNTDPMERAIGSLVGWLMRNNDVKLQHVDGVRPNSGLSYTQPAEAWYDDTRFWIPYDGVCRICGIDLEPKTLAKALQARGMLETQQADRLYWKAIPGFRGAGDSAKGKFLAIRKSALTVGAQEGPAKMATAEEQAVRDREIIEAIEGKMAQS